MHTSTASQDPRPFTANKDLSNSDIPVNHNLKDRFCSKPWEFIEIGREGKATACCPSWLPKLIGKLPEDSVEAAWNSDSMREIRASILDGSFRFCRPANCTLIASGTLPKRNKICDPKIRNIIAENSTFMADEPKRYFLSYDSSCNLSCPSCRTVRVNIADGPEYESLQNIHSRVIKALFSQPHDRHFLVNITGAGDPFASKLFRSLLTTVDGADYPNVVFDFQTNGVMFTRKCFEQMGKIKHNLGRIAVSFDAANPSTYSVTRRGGDWNQLIDNMSFMNELRQEKLIKNLTVEYVVQALNYQELPDFVNLLNRYKAVDTISFSLINNWGTYSAEEFKKQAIWQTDHPEFTNFLRVLCDPALCNGRIFWGNVYPYRLTALKQMGNRILLGNKIRSRINKLQNKITVTMRDALTSCQNR